MGSNPDRASIFIDGNNWYHSLRENGIARELSYKALSEKIIGPRVWTETRYYIGALSQGHQDFDAQRRFLGRLKAEDKRISVHYGRIEERFGRNPLCSPVRNLLKNSTDLPSEFVSRLRALLSEHENVPYLKEKAADVFLAVDLCRLALEDSFDAAYLFSADGDFTPAIETVKRAGKKVYVASPGKCYALGQVATFIALKPTWFDNVGR